MLSIEAVLKAEGKLVELKAKVQDLTSVRELLIGMTAQHVGTYRQIDRYFSVPRGMLKLRKIGVEDKVELVYYEREDIAGIKESNVFIVKIQDPKWFLSVLEKILKTTVTVEKVREIYLYTRVNRIIQIHLDTIEDLGTFVEFEMKTSGIATKIDKQILEDLMNELKIKTNQLEKRSYSDMLSKC